MGQIKPEEMMMFKIFIVAFLLVIVVDFAILVVYLHRKPRHGSVFSPRWSLMDVWLGAHAFAAGMIPISIASALIIAIFFGSDALTNMKGSSLMVLLAVGMAGQTFLMIAIPAFFITQKYRVAPWQIGFGWPPKADRILQGIAYGLGLFVVSVGLQLGLLAALQLLAGQGPTQELREVTSSLTAERLIKENRTPGMLLLMLFIASVLAPISEEVFFRGFIYNAAKHRFGIVAGVVISSLVFAVVHFGPLAIIGIIPMGILLALAYEKTGSLWVPITMHATNNFVAVILTYLMPQLGI